MICLSDNSITPLHVRSGFSLLRGSARIDDLIARAVRLGHRRLALTDVNGLYGITQFYTKACEAWLEPIVGAELEAPGLSAVALIDEPIGYENLCRILTRIHRGQALLPAVFNSAIGNPHFGNSAIRNPQSAITGGGDAALAHRLLEAGLEVDRLWLGVDPASQRHAVLRGLLQEAAQTGLPLVAMGRSLMSAEDELEVARLLGAIREGRTFEAVPPASLPHPRAFLRGSEVLRGELGYVPAEAGANNRRLAQRCAGYRLLPRPPVFPAYPCPAGLSPADYLRRLCMEGMDRRYGGPTPQAVHRLEKELALIQKMGFSEYFLVVWDIVRYARSRGVPVAGRGSGASSLAAYLLGITNVCPLAFEIPFERFLNERRGDFPDLDIDFCWRIRDDVIAYAFARWGAGQAAMVSVHTTFQPASALRETAKALGYSDDQISRMDDSETRRPRMREAARLARRLLDLPHVLSVHPGGIVLAGGPIDRYAPIQQAAKGVPITQFDKDGVEAVGLVKLDLLGNRSLSTLREACDLIARRTGRSLDVEALPGDDPATLAVLQSADTVGCNQLESPAMRHLLRALRPAHVRDVMQALALIRPGAASIGMKEVFLRRCRGEVYASPYPPAVEEILRPACGVMLYEDDVMLVAAAMLGCPLAEADRFRKAVQKCRDDGERLRLSREFLDRSRANGMDPAAAKDLWVQMAKFNAYSFCRAHAASYGQLAYAVAYLRAHWPLEFYVAALNNNQSMYHPRVYVEQAKREGIRFLLPDVNASGEEFTCEGQAVRTGLCRVGGLGPAGVGTILAARRRGPFEGLADFLRRTALGREETRSLILCGAFDSLGRSRPERMMELDLCLGGPRDGEGDLLLPVAPSLGAALGDYTPQRKYADQRRILGFSVERHILAVYRPGLAGQTDADSRDLSRRVGRRVRLAGMLEAHRAAPTQKGRTMRFLTLDDEHGLFDVTLFPDPSAACGSLDAYGPYLVTGRVEEQHDVVTVTAETIELATALPAGLALLR